MVTHGTVALGREVANLEPVAEEVRWTAVLGAPGLAVAAEDVRPIAGLAAVVWAVLWEVVWLVVATPDFAVAAEV